MTIDEGTRAQTTRSDPAASRTIVIETGDPESNEVGTIRTSAGWGPVLSGAVTTFITFAILSALWLAIAGSGVGFIADNFGWFELVSALIAAPIGGYAAGWLDRGRTPSGALQGLATWGLLIFAGLIVGVPTGADLFSGATGLTLQGTDVTGQLGQVSAQLWAVFAVFAGGAVMAALGGAAAGRAGRAQDAGRTGSEQESDVRDPAGEGASQR